MSNETKICPFCSEEIKATARKCRYCLSLLVPDTSIDDYLKPNMTDIYLSPGVHLGDYEVVRLIGEGGMGVVYKTIYHGLGEPIDRAIKTVPDVVCKDPRSLKRLQKEVIIATSLSHPNIVRVYGLEQYQDIYFITMEYINGYDFREYLDKQGGRIGLERTVNILKGVAEALDYAHGLKKPIIHRDLKPQNLIYDKFNKQLKVVDFGIAAEITDSVTTLTKTKFGTSGSPRYMCYEQFMGEEPAVHMDSYAFGIIVYEALKGEPPFVRGDLFLQHKEKEIPKIKSLNESRMKVLRNSLNKRIEARYKKLTNILNDLAEKSINNTESLKKDNNAKNIKSKVNSKSALKKIASTNINKDLSLNKIGDIQKLHNTLSINQKQMSISVYKSSERKLLNKYFNSIEIEAKNENELGQYYLGICYEKGVNVSKNIKEAAKLYQSSAQKGIADAQYRLGNCFYYGDGVNRNRSIAKKWFQKAALQNHQKAINKISILGLNNLNTKVKKTSKTIQSVNSVYDLDQLMRLSNRNNNKRKKIKSNIEQIQEFAEKNNTKAQIILGDYYYDEKFIDHYQKAFYWYKKAAESGDVKTQVILAKCYSDGLGTEQNMQESAKWYLLAAKSGNKIAQFYIGKFYFYGWGVNADYYRAFINIKDSAEKGFDEAQYYLAYFYCRGYGVQKSENDALYWLEKSANQWHKKARDKLEEFKRSGKLSIWL